VTEEGVKRSRELFVETLWEEPWCRPAVNSAAMFDGSDANDVFAVMEVNAAVAEPQPETELNNAA
jgi:hypothetical protein